MVTRIDVCYYAQCQETGRTYECKDFRELYKWLLYEFRRDIYRSVFYNRRDAVIKYGILAHDSDKGKTQHIEYRSVCFLTVSGLRGAVRTYIERW